MHAYNIIIIITLQNSWMSKTYNMIGLINYNLARLHLKLSRVGELIRFDGNKLHNFTAEGKRVEIGIYSSSRV